MRRELIFLVLLIVAACSSSPGTSTPSREHSSQSTPVPQVDPTAAMAGDGCLFTAGATFTTARVEPGRGGARTAFGQARRSCSQPVAADGDSFACYMRDPADVANIERGFLLRGADLWLIRYLVPRGASHRDAENAVVKLLAAAH
jgi:hypothetical protein